MLGNYVAKKSRALFGGGPSAEGLANGEDIVIDGLGQTNHGESVIVLGQVGGEIGCGGIGIIATDGVQHVDAVFDELVGCDFLRILAFGDETPFYAVCDVGEFYPAITDGAAAVAVE